MKYFLDFTREYFATTIAPIIMVEFNLGFYFGAVPKSIFALVQDSILPQPIPTIPQTVEPMQFWKDGLFLTS